ncbi:MAG: DHH family phosphoesterase [Paludibacteraceae bacterium]|nr:DHH family phosphoesterase [Candidatus Physcocola equi]MCQ2234123.1 DHH family phosphoesterase [Paludibacteraceae bacterium]
MPINIDASLSAKAKQIILSANDIVVTCHVSPDGDAIGSSLAVYHYLKSIGKNVTVVVPTAFPAFLKWLPDARNILVYKDQRAMSKEAIKHSDLIVCVDFNEISRLGEDGMPDYVAGARAKKLMIDHHLYPGDFTVLTISYPLASSTCHLVYLLLSEWMQSETLPTDIAQCIYTGMMTDTGNFSYNSNDPQIYETIASLIKSGINKDEIYKKVFFNCSAGRIKLQGIALNNMEVLEEYGTAVLSLSRDELNSQSYKKGDTEGFVNIPLSIHNVFFSVFFKEEDGFIKVSLRSQGDFPCNIIATDVFGGGGHLNASGGEAHNITIAEAKQKLIDALPNYKQYFDVELAKLQD